MRKQQGMTFIGLVLIIAMIVFVAVIGIKLTPSYLEYMSIKKVISKIGHEPGFAEMNAKDIKDEFSKGVLIDSIKAVTDADLVIAKNESGKNTVSVEYQAVVPLVANISALMDFSASTDESPAK